MIHRRTARLAALSATAALVVACSPSAGDGAQTGGDGAAGGGGEDVTLTVWSWRTEDAAAYERIFDVYEQEHENVTVEFRPYVNTEYNTILATGLTQAGGPDVAQLRSYGGLQPLVEAGSLVALDDKVDGLDAFAETVLAGAKGQTDGNVYGVPFATQTLQIYYNTALFEEHGVEPPATWEEMVAAAETLDAAGVTPFATTGQDVWMLPIVHDIFGSARYGGGEFQEALMAGETDFTDPDYVASLELVKELQPYFPDDVVGVTYTDAQILFTTGQAAMFPGGSFELNFFQQQAPDLELGVFSVPPPPGSVLTEPVVPGYADGSFGVNAASTQQEEAVELVSWMATEEFGQLFTDELKQISAVPGVVPEDELLAEMAQAYDTNPSPYLLLVDFRYGQPTGTDLAGAGIQSMLLDEADAETVASQIQKGVSQWWTPQQ